MGFRFFLRVWDVGMQGLVILGFGVVRDLGIWGLGS